MINSNELELLLNEFDLGASTAEKDPLLETAKIETQEFCDIYFHDRIDIIRGIKGSGKTALYRLFDYIQGLILQEKKTACIFGIEASGDPVFRYFQDQLKTYSEVEFENFWSLYFIILIYQELTTTAIFREMLTSDDNKEIDDILYQIGIRVEKRKSSLRETIDSILKLFSVKKVEIGLETKIDASMPNIISFVPKVKLEYDNKKDNKVPIYVTDFKNVIISILKKYNYKIWIMLDRLDEVFPHRSELEKYGLKGLLKAAYNISDPFIRIKIFLRSDIFEYLSEDGFTALTHVMDRCSTPMSWSQDSILLLIMSRITANQNFISYYNIDKEKIQSDHGYRLSMFQQIFPPRIGKMLTIEWLYNNCADSNKTVTPRDIIDFFKFAKAAQYKKYRLNPKPQQHLILEDTFKESLGHLSEHKKTTYLFAEFNHLKKYFQIMENRYSEYDEKNIKKLYGEDWKKIVAELSSIGFIGHIPKSATFKIPVIWRKGLNIKTRKVIGKRKKAKRK